jgi:hypothetical protein
MMMMIFLEMEVLEVVLEEVQDFNHFNLVVLVAWEEEWENLLANKQLLKMDVKKLLQKKQKLIKMAIKPPKLLKNIKILELVSTSKINI